MNFDKSFLSFRGKFSQLRHITLRKIRKDDRKESDRNMIQLACLPSTTYNSCVFSIRKNKFKTLSLAKFVFACMCGNVMVSAQGRFAGLLV